MTKTYQPVMYEHQNTSVQHRSGVKISSSYYRLENKIAIKWCEMPHIMHRVRIFRFSLNLLFSTELPIYYFK